MLGYFLLKIRTYVCTLSVKLEIIIVYTYTYFNLTYAIMERENRLKFKDSGLMKWEEVGTTYPNKFVKFEILEYYLEGNRRIFATIENEALEQE